MVRQPEYCGYRSIKLLICSWNVSALVPQTLSDNVADQSFFKELFASVDSPDIIVFGFQELIDLNDKATTAKSFFLGRTKKNDGKLQDQVSHQYQRWRDRLAQAVLAAMPESSPYSILQADVLVGLFTCVFVKNSLKGSLRDPAMALVKTGFSGRFGNKVRLLFTWCSC
jgi:hypothetical protein